MATELGCRSCHHSPLQVVLSLGKMPLANALLTADQLAEPEPAFPLDLAWCPRCTLVQITETVPPETLFRDYVYFSSYSDTMVRHAGELATRLRGRVHRHHPRHQPAQADRGDAAPPHHAS